LYHKGTSIVMFASLKFQTHYFQDVIGVYLRASAVKLSF